MCSCNDTNESCCLSQDQSACFSFFAAHLNTLIFRGLQKLMTHFVCLTDIACLLFAIPAGFANDLVIGRGFLGYLLSAIIHLEGWILIRLVVLFDL